MEPTLLESQLKEAAADGFPVSKGTRTVGMNEKPGSVTRTNKRALEVWLPTWIRNAAENYQTIRNFGSLGWLRGAARDLPVIVVGIGPSLDQDIKSLQKVSARNAIVIATDAALRPLLARGIKPHLVVTFDCKETQYTLFEGLQEFTKDLVLLANSCSHPRALKEWAGPVLFYNMKHPGVNFMDIVLPTMFPGFGPLTNHGTVGNACILLAYSMGAKTILLCGMDLCYQKGEEGGYQYRCEDFRWEWEVMPPYDPHWTPTVNQALYENSERLAETFEVKIKELTFLVDDPLNTYRKGALDIIGTIGEIEVIDCSQGGILSACGVKHLKLADAILEYCSREIEPGEASLLHLARHLPRLNNDAKGA